MRIVRSCAVVLLGLLVSGFSGALWCETRTLDRLDMERARVMLRQTYLEVRKNYYDPGFHGIDLDAAYHRYDAMLASADSLNAALRDVAEFLGTLRDSHTVFVPPERTLRSAPGFRMRMVGYECFITGVRKGSDAASRLHVGDRVLAMDGIAMKREYFARLVYLLEVVSQTRTETLLVEGLDGVRRTEVIQNIVNREPVLGELSGGSGLWRLIRAQENEELKQQRTYASGDTLIWKMPSFDVEPDAVDRVIAKARKYESMVLDLRGNAGGRFGTLKEMIASIFTRPVLLGTRVSRRGSEAEMIKPKRKPFTGKLIVLIDSASASAAEVFARVIQIEHRGIVVGGQSAGAVMEARYFAESFGGDPGVAYGISVSTANLILSDGRSLEGRGVTPDELVLPTAADLEAGSDPALARAAELAGVKLDSQAAGKLFPIKWRFL